MLSQVIPFSIESIIPFVTHILFNTITIWLSAKFVTDRATIQSALIFSVVAYFALVLLRFIPIPSIPFVSIIVIIEVLIKSLLAMKLFNADFRGGVCIAGVQMLFGFILLLPF